MIEYLFPTPIYKNNIPCPKKEWDGMMDVCERFYNKNIQEINDCGNFTGDQDTQEFFLLHTTEQFYWLNYHMGQAVKEYLNGSLFSGVYNLRSEGSGGTLNLQIGNEMDMLPLNLKPHLGIFQFNPVDGDLIVFPSSVMHNVRGFSGSHYRASIVYDIFITSSETVDDRYENIVT